MTIDYSVATLTEHKMHWCRLLREKICNEKDGKDTIEALDMAIKALEREPREDAISREDALMALTGEWTELTDEMIHRFIKRIKKLPPVTPQPKTGHWSRKTKVDAYDIAGVKTWGIKCQCDKCDFTTIVVEDFGYYKYCPNCGAKMVESEE